MGLLEGSDYEVRHRSAFLLVRIGLDNQQVVAAITRLLKDDDPRMRAVTAYAFDGSDEAHRYGEIGPTIGPDGAKVAIPLLVALLEDEDRQVRSAATGALGDIAQGILKKPRRSCPRS